MNYQEALQYIHSICWRGSRPGLSRTEELLQKLQNPQDSLKFIHVAGTNGKGSFCSMLSSVLIEAGYRVGTYTSPYILRFNERMKINGEDIPDERLAELTEKVRVIADGMQDPPTEFELITAIAMEYFRQEKCDLVILECGMGGRLDSTNVIKTPILSVITGIALDHTAFLGDTVEKIAAEKAGIIKEGIPVLYCGAQGGARDVIEAKAKEMHAPFHTVDRTSFCLKAATLQGTEFSFEAYQSVKIPLLGSYQPKNACNVLTAVSLLSELGLSLPEEAVLRGMDKVKWPARYEILRRDPLFLADGGHNPEGIDAAVESTKLYFKEKLLVVTGVMADKEYRYMAKRISEIACEVFCLTPDNPRSLDAKEYAAVFEQLGVPASAHPSAEEAVKAAVNKAKKEGKPILSLGSLYLYGQVYDALNKL